MLGRSNLATRRFLMHGVAPHMCLSSSPSIVRRRCRGSLPRHTLHRSADRAPPSVLSKPALAPLVVFDVAKAAPLILQREAEIEFAHVLVLAQLFACTVQDDAAAFDDVTVVAQRHGRVRVLLDKEEGSSLARG